MPEENNKSQTSHANIINRLSPTTVPSIEFYMDGIGINGITFRLSNVSKNLWKMVTFVTSVKTVSACSPNPNFVSLPSQTCLMDETNLNYVRVDLDPSVPELQPVIQALSEAAGGNGRFCNFGSVRGSGCFVWYDTPIVSESFSSNGSVVAEVSTICVIDETDLPPAKNLDCVKDFIQNSLYPPPTTNTPTNTVTNSPLTPIPTEGTPTPTKISNHHKGSLPIYAWILIAISSIFFIALCCYVLYRYLRPNGGRDLENQGDNQRLLPPQRRFTFFFVSREGDNRKNRELEQLNINPAEDKILRKYICPFTSYLPDDPVRLHYKVNGTECERYCEREAIYYRKDYGISCIDPKTGQLMTDIRISECPEVKAIIQTQIAELTGGRFQQAPVVVIN